MTARWALKIIVDLPGNALPASVLHNAQNALAITDGYCRCELDNGQCIDETCGCPANHANGEHADHF